MLNQYFAHELFHLQHQELEKRARQGNLAGVALRARRRRRRAETERLALQREVEVIRNGLDLPADSRPVVHTRR